MLEINPQLSDENGDLNAEIEMFAIRNRDSNVIWDTKIPLDHDTVSNIANNNSTLVIDIPEVQQSMDQRNLELPQGSVVKYRITFNSEYSYEGEEFQQSARLTIEPDTPQTYRVRTTQESDPKSQTVTNVRPVPSKTTEIYDRHLETDGIIASIIGLVVFILGLYLLYGVRFDDRTEDELLFAYHLEKYKDWVTFGRPFTDPQFMSQNERNKIKVNSLKGLVQVSVDSDRRVIYSEELNRFYIFADEHIYIFDPPNSTSPLKVDNSIPAVPKPNFGFGSDPDEDEFPANYSDNDGDNDGDNDNTTVSWMDNEVPDNTDMDSASDERNDEIDDSEINKHTKNDNDEDDSEKPDSTNKDEIDENDNDSNEGSGGWKWT